MAKTRAVMKYIGRTEPLMWHNIRWTNGKVVEFDQPEDILAIRNFMNRPDFWRNWEVKIEEVPLIGPPKVKAEVKNDHPEPAPQTKKEIDKAKDEIDKILEDTKPKRSYSSKYSKKKR